MPEADDVIGWDFLTLVDTWNLYGLPALLVAVVIAVLIRTRARPAATAYSGSARTLLLIGLIHGVLAFQSGISLTQELLVWGQSFVTPVGAMFGLFVNPILAIGLLRRRPWARRLAITWYVLVSLLAILVVVWWFYYRVPIDLSRWSEQIAPKIQPFFLLVVMLLPRIKRVFDARAGAGSADSTPVSPGEAGLSPGARTGWSALSLLTLLFLIIACSNLAVSAADWGYRLMFESESLP